MPVVPSIDDLLTDDNLTTSKKMLLIVLARHAHSDGTGCYPSLRRVSRLSSLSLAHVCTLLAELETTGYLSIERFKGPKGVNAYVLHKRGAPVSGAPESGAPESGARSTGAPVSGTKVQAEEEEIPVLFQPVEHQPVEHQPDQRRGVAVTRKAANLVKCWVGPDFFQVLQGQESDPTPAPAAPVQVSCEPATPQAKPRYDITKFYEGTPCHVADRLSHLYQETGKSLRYSKDDTCYRCVQQQKQQAQAAKTRVIDLAAHRQAQGG